MSAPQPLSQTNVAVIGAGPAGLQAANLVAQAGLTVVVLEGRDRVGGRLLSLSVEDGSLDLGATWFWPNEPLINELVTIEQLPTFSQHLHGDTVFQGENGTERVPGNRLDVPSGRLVTGTQSIADALAVRLAGDTVKLEQVVTSVRVERDAVLVTTNNASWLAQQLIIAVPPATALATIDFDGQLPSEVAHLAKSTPVWMGNIVKVVAHYQEPFWRNAGLAGAGFSYRGPLREIHDMSGPNGAPAALFGFSQPGAGNPTPSKKTIIDQLVELFGPAAADPLNLFIHDWRDEPLTSPQAVHGLDDYSTYGNPMFCQPVLDGRAHWASTETATTAPGHIEGALQAGTRAANAAVNQIRSR